MKFLIVDDSPLVQRIMLKIFDSIENEVLDVAEDGPTASDLIKNNGYDLILLDCKLPGKDGIDILREMREAGNKVPVIMVTANSEEEQISEALDAGANDYIAKPFTAATVLEKISSIISI